MSFNRFPSLTNTVVTVATVPLPPTQGGTGLTSNPSNGQILIGTASNVFVLRVPTDPITYTFAGV